MLPLHWLLLLGSDIQSAQTTSTHVGMSLCHCKSVGLAMTHLFAGAAGARPVPLLSMPIQDDTV